ncbi:two pore domain potassium channel family protein [Streptomyces spectabilis]|uniref:Two pore domain potassium channel family protein n=2 Tax=Streptomyces spectabilis TaxID=68270 RepID=A0A516R1H0_STRST|nr:two pore domain potassium channel family protein [Streptomyces spectabilis]
MPPTGEIAAQDVVRRPRPCAPRPDNGADGLLSARVRWAGPGCGYGATVFGLVIMFARLGGALRAAWSSPTFRGTACALALLWASATVFYAGQERWSVLDSLYFAVCTGLTIGYGDLAPVTALGKVFTVLYGLLAVGAFAALATQLARAFTTTNVRRVARAKARRQRHHRDD